MRGSRRFAPGFPRFASRTLLFCSLLLCLTLVACFGSSDDETPTPAPTATTVPSTVAPAPTLAPTAAATETATEAASTDSTTTSSTTTSSATTETEEASPEQASGERLRFVLDPEQSEARFIIQEVLFGNPNIVTGVTNEISGEIEIDLNNPPQTTVSELRINARALSTDNRFRNRSVNRLILQANRDEYQYITFTPTAIDGLPAEVGVGDTFTFRITGDLKIRDIVQPTEFEVTVTADSATQITGLAQTIVQRADFELTIPDVDGVADVAEEVRLELAFVALASE